jgi:hydrogenase 3 maturation protease
MSPEIRQGLLRFLQGRVCILGFGNRQWRDDGAGSRLAEALAADPDLTSIDGGFVPENHLEVVARAKPDTVLLVDAADFGGLPGQLRLLQPDDIALANVSTHAGSPQMLARYLSQRTGGRVALLAIQPGDTAAGDRLSPEVESTVNGLVEMLSGLARAAAAK